MKLTRILMICALPLLLGATCAAWPAASAQAPAQGNMFYVRYRGGTVAAKVKSGDWGNLLTLYPGEIHLHFKDGQVFTVSPKSVTALSYGREATRRLKTYAGVAVVIPFVLFRVGPKETKHFIGIEYTDGEGKSGALLLQARGEDYRAVLTTLEGITGRKAEVREKK
jgi:hypothetical protein